MANIVKSARGVMVDFDLLKIKEQIATTPKTTVVQAREDFIDRKFSRRVNKIKKQIVSAQLDVTATGPVETLEDLDDSEFENDNGSEQDDTPTEPTTPTTPTTSTRTGSRRKL